MKEKKNVISFMNMKGGVAKSTLCANIAYTLSKEFDKKILLIDMDPQFNLTSLIIPEKEYFENIYGKCDISSIFEISKPSAKEEININKDDIIKKISDNLHIVPGSLDLISINSNEDMYYKLKSFIDDNLLKEKYHYIFIDCPPTKGHYLTIAFYATDYYVIPVKPDYLSAIGVELFKKTITEKNKNPLHKIDQLGIIFTLVNEGTNHHSEKMRQIKDDYEYSVFKSSMKHSYKIPEFAEKHIMIYDLSADILKKEGSNISLLKHRDDIIELSKEFIERMEEKS
jgi:chromosome partitioning protein